MNEDACATEKTAEGIRELCLWWRCWNETMQQIKQRHCSYPLRPVLPRRFLGRPGQAGGTAPHSDQPTGWSSHRFILLLLLILILILLLIVLLLVLLAIVTIVVIILLCLLECLRHDTSSHLFATIV